MVLNVSPCVNHKIKYSKETIWLKLENTIIRLLVVMYMYMYIWNLIVTATCTFPVNYIVLKVEENSYMHAVSTFQHYWKWRGGARMTCRTEQSWESMRRRFTIYSIFSSYKKIDFLYKKINPISWYQNFIFWFKEIHFLISNRSILDIKKLDRIFSYQEMDFWYQKTIFVITKYRMTSNQRHLSAPFWLYIRYFVLFLI